MRRCRPEEQVHGFSRFTHVSLHAAVHAFVTGNDLHICAAGPPLMRRDAKNGLLAVHVDVVKQPRGPWGTLQIQKETNQADKFSPNFERFSEHDGAGNGGGKYR